MISLKYSLAGGFKEGLAYVEVGGECFRHARYGLGWRRGKYGYINKKGQVAIPVIYEEPSEFSEGLAAVQLKKKFGYIDRTGKFVISPQFDMAGPFWYGIAKVMKDRKLAYIDRTGSLVWMSPEYLPRRRFWSV